MEIKSINYRISIIIPIYNVELYVTQCLDNVINQTYQDLEIILVNDGSTDSCPKICDEYALLDDRIKVIHKSNGGLSDARNAGLTQATGDFISFVDSDDIVAVNFCEKLLQALIENNADIVECGFYKFETDLDLPKGVVTAHATIEIFETKVAIELLMKNYFSQVVWNKLYKRKLLVGLEFPLNKINEDEYFTYKAFASAIKIGKISGILYYYRQQAASIMGGGYSLRRLDGLQAFEERISYMKEHFPSLANLAIKTFCFGAAYHFQQLYINGNLDPKKELRKKIFSKVKDYNKLSIYKNWDSKDIVWYQLFVYFPKIYMKMRDYMVIKAQKRLN